MLPTIHNQAYQLWLDSLIRLREQLLESPLDCNTLLLQFQQVQQIFQEQIMVLTNNELEPAIASSWQSLQTESHRALRLLRTDLLFLRSSRSSDTIQLKLATIRDRLDQLISYCTAVLSS